MAAYLPVITTQPDAAVDATGAGISYDELLNSFSQYNFFLDSMFVQSSSISQISQPLLWSSYDVNGKKYYSVTPPTPDPYQKQPTILVEVKDENVVVNGRSQLNFDLLALSHFTMIVKARKNYIADYLALKNKDLINK